jgi:hypothetical protein
MSLVRSAVRLLARIPGARRVWLKLPVGGVDLRTEHDIWTRPAYAFGLYAAAELALQLRISAISAIEFGVAGGDGLVMLEQIAAQIGPRFGVKISVYGFDTGTGMPPPRDYRDLPHVWGPGFYKMDESRLRARLRHAELILGDVHQTVPAFLSRANPAPVGFVSFDLDYYSSTKGAFRIFGGSPATRLPRVLSYFDDTIWPLRAYYNEYTGELRAIHEFNAENMDQKICKIHALSWVRAHAAAWNEQMYVCHDFAHPLYTRLITPEGAEFRQL